MRVAFGLGSNLGDREEHLRTGLAAVASLGELAAVSSVYETAPVGGPAQGPYLNAVAVVDTDAPPDRVAAVIAAAEHSTGRERRERWGPRTLDIDVLLADPEFPPSGLTVPHPRMRDRRFVLEPLVEAWPDATLPDGTPVRSLLSAVAGQDVNRVGPFRADPDVFGVPPALVFLVTGLAAVFIWIVIGWLL